MTWYEIINAKSESYVADRDAEDLVRHLAAALQTADAPVEAEMFYGRTSNGARRYYVALSPEAVERADRVLASYDATELTAPPDLGPNIARLSFGATADVSPGKRLCRKHLYSAK